MHFIPACTLALACAYSCPASLNSSSRLVSSFSFFPLRRFLPPFPENHERKMPCARTKINKGRLKPRNTRTEPGCTYHTTGGEAGNTTGGEAGNTTGGEAGSFLRVYRARCYARWPHCQPFAILALLSTAAPFGGTSLYTSIHVRTPPRSSVGRVRRRIWYEMASCAVCSAAFRVCSTSYA